MQDQLDRLRRVQEEIETKNTLDRLETEQIFKDLLDSNRRLSLGASRDQAFNVRSLPAHVTVTERNSHMPHLSHMSGNIRLETKFTRIPGQPASNSNFASAVRNSSPSA